LHEGIGHLGIRYGVRAKFLDALALSSPGLRYYKVCNIIYLESA
jgi:hypothetical protein